MIRKTISLMLALVACSLLVVSGCGEPEPPPSTATVPKKPRRMTIPQADGKPLDTSGSTSTP
jgi:hypothetical protein